jgi:hypothetical protein
VCGGFAHMKDRDADGVCAHRCAGPLGEEVETPAPALPATSGATYPCPDSQRFSQREAA